MFCQPLTQLNKNDTTTAGGKGASLGELTQAGLKVPSGFVILTIAFEQFLTQANLHNQIQAELDRVNQYEGETVEKAAEIIQGLIAQATMPKDIVMAIQTSFKDLGAEFVAVRSSATGEDSANASWAGELESYLYTTSANLLQNVQRCWASLFTPRAIFYRLEKGLQDSKVSVAVVVQKMVNPQVSGVAFSVHPVTQDPNQLIIEAGYGLGEAIVSGSITPDNYVVSKQDGSIIDSYIVNQERALYQGKKGGIEWQEVPLTKREQAKLLPEKVQELAHLVVKIEQYYGFPCDIEWALENDTLYIVQSRPITTLTTLN